MNSFWWQRTHWRSRYMIGPFPLGAQPVLRFLQLTLIPSNLFRISVVSAKSWLYSMRTSWRKKKTEHECSLYPEKWDLFTPLSRMKYFLRRNITRTVYDGNIYYGTPKLSNVNIFHYICGAFYIICSAFYVICNAFLIICVAFVIIRDTFIIICGAFVTFSSWHQPQAGMIAGVIDGFSRLPMAIECQTNEAETVSQCLLEGVEMYGLPTAVRSDKVRKNVITRRGACLLYTSPSPRDA